jgi:hypothetical protein
MVPYFSLLIRKNEGIEATSMATENMVKQVIECE